MERGLAAKRGLQPLGRLVGKTLLYPFSGPDFFNAVIALDTMLGPLALLQALQTIEHHHGRLRPYVNAPRTLDLDLLLYGAQTLQMPGLQVPHPRMHQRAFVLLPLHEVAPDIQIPGIGAVKSLIQTVQDQALQRMDGRCAFPRITSIPPWSSAPPRLRPSRLIWLCRHGPMTRKLLPVLERPMKPGAEAVTVPVAPSSRSPLTNVTPTASPGLSGPAS